MRAEFGDDAVVQAKLEDGHLPEARFAWEPLNRVKLPRNDLNGLNDLNVLNSPTPKVLVRRIMAKPISLPGGPRHTHEDGWLILGHKYGSVDKLSAPMSFPAAGGTKKSSATTTSPKPAAATSPGSTTIGCGEDGFCRDGSNNHSSNRYKSSNCFKVGGILVKIENLETWNQARCQKWQVSMWMYSPTGETYLLTTTFGTTGTFGTIGTPQT